MIKIFNLIKKLILKLFTLNINIVRNTKKYINSNNFQLKSKTLKNVKNLHIIRRLRTLGAKGFFN